MTLADASLGCFAAATALPVIAAVRIPRAQLTKPVWAYILFVAMFALAISMMLMWLNMFIMRPR